MTKRKNFIDKSHDIIFKTKTIFPWTIFTDKIEITFNKVVIKKRFFFRSKVKHYLLIANIQAIQQINSPLFASLKIKLINAPDKPINIKYLRKYDALQAKQLITGLMIYQNNKKKLKNLKGKKLIAAIKKLGSTT